MLRQFIIFGMIGAAGFLIDAGTYLLAFSLGTGLAGRFFSFLCAATFTWVLNRAYNFKDRTGTMFAQWSRFLLANSAGAFVNLGVFFLIMTQLEWARTNPGDASVVAIGAGSIAGLIFNFGLSKMFVFKDGSNR